MIVEQVVIQTANINLHSGRLATTMLFAELWIGALTDK